MSDRIHNLLRGAAAGFVATVPMTVVLQLVHRGLPQQQRLRPIQPREIIERTTKLAGLHDDLSAVSRKGITYLAHFGYGTAAGSLYGALSALLPGPPVVRGIGFALGVWAAGYLGWLPLTGLYPPVTREPAGRNVLNLAAHITWGASLGAVSEQISEGQPRSLSRRGEETW